MKFFVYTLMTIFFMSNITLNNSDDSEEVKACAENIFNHIRSSDGPNCLTKMFIRIDKPAIPIIPFASKEPNLDIQLSNLENWVKYAFYLGERVIFKLGLMKPTRFCRTLYLNKNITATINRYGDLVYPYGCIIGETFHKKNDVIKLTEEDKPDVLTEHDDAKFELATNRNECVDTLNYAGLRNEHSEKQLFDTLYRTNDIFNEENFLLAWYSKHFMGKTTLLEGTLDSLPFCRICSVFAALNNDDDASSSNGRTLNLINKIGNINNESSVQRDRSRSPPITLPLFPVK